MLGFTVLSDFVISDYDGGSGPASTAGPSSARMRAIYARSWRFFPRIQFEVFYEHALHRKHGQFTRPIANTNAGYKFHPPVPEIMPNDVEHRRQIVRKVNFLNMAKFNAFVDVTLTPNATTTTLTDGRIGTLSAIFPAMATTANGATAIAAGVYVTNQVTGSCTINHANSANTDQHIRFLIIG